MRTITEEALRARVIDIVEAGSFSQASRQFGVSRSYIHRVVNGAPVGPKLAASLGYAAEPRRFRRIGA